MTSAARPAARHANERMNIMVACSLFAMLILLYWVISEIFTVLFHFTGLPDEKARFQVMSLLTGCGFTTRESEMVVTTRTRRRLARITMLFGYVFNITIVSAFVNVFLSFKLSDVTDFVGGIFIPLAVIVLVLLLMRFQSVRVWVSYRIERMAGRIMGREGENAVLLMDYIGQDALAQVTINAVPEGLQDRTLADTDLKSEYNILVMLVEHSDEKAVPADGSTQLLPGDKLTVFGDYRTICEAFEARERFAE